MGIIRVCVQAYWRGVCETGRRVEHLTAVRRRSEEAQSERDNGCEERGVAE